MTTTALQPTTNAALERRDDASLYESLALKGDISGLKPEDKVRYYGELCKRLGLDPHTQPFIPLKLNGKEILYASKGATDQLARIHRLNRTVVTREHVQDVYVVTVRAELPNGRTEESIGAVPLGTIKGDALANALMKAETKAKRRVTLAILGLGMLDESELETIPARAMQTVPHTIASAAHPEDKEHPTLAVVARQLVALGYVVKTESGYTVKSASARHPDESFVVTRDQTLTPQIRCTCPAFVEAVKTDPGFRCEHILAVKIFVTKTPTPEASSIGEEQSAPATDPESPEAKREAYVARVWQFCDAMNEKGHLPRWTPVLLGTFINELFMINGGIDALSFGDFDKLLAELSSKLDLLVSGEDERIRSTHANAALARAAESGDISDEEVPF